MQNKKLCLLVVDGHHRTKLPIAVHKATLSTKRGCDFANSLNPQAVFTFQVSHFVNENTTLR
jgi:hypothetical protein